MSEPEVNGAKIGLPARRLAWEVLEAVAAGAYADVALERAIRQSSLSPADRGLATELAYGCIRWRQWLDGWLDRLGKVPAHKQPPRLRWLLHLGLYQVLRMQRIPAAAAVDTTVELAKRHRLSKLSPVVNGVLRSAQIKIDDVSQHVPSLAVYGLNALGIKGKNNFKDRTIILGTASLIMGSTVSGMKKATSIERPDASNKSSFPSGSTAIAFMGAEFLYQEYKEVSIWYGISGYLVATGTGFLRLDNNKHWFTDVVTGAGIGILSTKIAYWIHPLVKRTLFKDKEEVSGIVMPFYTGKEYGLGLSMSF